jgi:hypothetical protein
VPRYSFAIFDYVVVPKPQDTPTFFFEESIAPVVITGLDMLSAIGLNDEPSFRTGEINDIWRNHELSSKSPAQLPVAQHLPKRALRVGRIVTQLPRALARLFAAAQVPFGIRHG